MASRMSKVCPECQAALPKRTNDYDNKAKQLFESVQESENKKEASYGKGEIH